ncbi:MAG: hypothetical protein JWO62_3034 [Acidimicrobiaceae bacterium]|nr:hypothetical protein [Acidimicrobiaceae bacterium]
MDLSQGAPIADGDPLGELARGFSDTARIIFGAGSATDTLAEVVELSVVTVEGCDFAGIVLVEGDVISPPVYTDPLVDEIDALQRSTGEGPTRDAIANQLIIYVDDLADEDRWPQFGRAMTSFDLHSMLALPLATDRNLGALNLYSRYPAAFGAVDRAKGVILASLAGLALTVARTHEDDERLAENLNAALTTRELIGQAQGILMERERITARQAFEILRRASQHFNRRLRDVAQDLVNTGESPKHRARGDRRGRSSRS